MRSSRNGNDHHQPAADGQRFERGVKATLEIAQLIVHMDAQALECAGRRILALLPGGVGNRDHFGQIGGPFERALLAALHDGASYPLGEAFFAIFLEDRAISSSVALAMNSAALMPRPGFMRMSSGPSLRKLKPRSGSSSCGDDTPRSSRTPSTRPSRPRARTSSPSSANERALMTKRAVFGRQCFSCLDGLGIFVESEQASPRRPVSRARLDYGPLPKVPSR